MNKPVTSADLVTPKVTTGSLPASRKVYCAPDAAPDLRVPLREIVLDPSSGEPPLPVYDTTGVYSDPDVAIDVEKGLSRARIDWVKERGGVEEYEGRPIQPVDNGNVTGKHLARNFPNTPKPWRAVAPSPRLLRESGEGALRRSSESRRGPLTRRGQKRVYARLRRAMARGASPRTAGRGETEAHPLTQLEWARAGVVTKEMIYIAERENLGRKKQLERAEAALADGEQFGGAVPAFVTPGVRARRKSRAAAPSSPPTSITPNSSR